MPIPRLPLRVVFSVLVLLLVITGLRCLWLWQPERQVDLHTRNLLSRASARNWSAVEKMISPEYEDKWGLKRDFVLREMREIFRHFFSLEILPAESIEILVQNKEGTAITTIRIQGNGTAIAEVVKSEANSLQSPFTFHWQQRSGKPWDWVLVQVDHPEFSPGRATW